MNQNTDISFDFSQSKDLMINATEMAKGFGKRVNHFTSNKEAKEYILALKTRYRDSGNGDVQIIKAVQGGKPELQGTWMHRKLAIRFAQWLSPEFAIWVDEIIESILLGNQLTRKPLDLDSRILAKEILVNDLEVANILGLSPLKSKMTVVKQVAKITGVDYHYILKDYVFEITDKKEPKKETKYLSPTELAKHFNLKSPEMANMMLRDRGLQQYDHKKEEWIPINDGKKICKRVKWVNGSDHHLKWNPDLISNYL